MSKIAFIPIDNRPVCYQLPKLIINLDRSHEIFMPPKNFLGDIKKQADIENILSWIESIEDIDILIVSLDTIAYGGLIPSRRCNDNIDEIKSRVDRLSKIIKNKSIKVFAFSSIMRISNNNENEEEKEYWKDYGKKIFEYSFKLHKNGNTQSDIPQNILNNYLLTRKRNFEINKYYLELKKCGIFDTLIFSKDDCAEFGLNVQEAEILKKENVEGVFIKTGADEIPLTLLSRAINKQKKIKIAPVYMNTESTNKISKYEDISVKDSVNSQIELSGGILSDETECDMLLLVNNFDEEQGELVMNVSVPLFDKTLNLPDKPYFVADIRNANGADNNFVQALFKKENLKNFYGYSAWNTTGNTLGGGIAAALTYYNAKKPDKIAFNELQIIRFLDDWAYQANVRKQIRDNVDNLKNDKIKNEMSNYENIVCEKFKITHLNISYDFPWNRFFEIEVSLV